MTELRPLAVYPYPLPEAQAQAVRAIKQAMNLDYQVVMVQALPGGPTRVLAFEPPPFLADYALVTNALGLGWALQWVLNPAIQDKRGVIIVDQLREIFGPAVCEVLDER